MTQVVLSLPDQAGLALRLPPDKLPHELLLAAAMKLYEVGRLSAGAAAELAGVPKPVFLPRQTDYGVVAFRQSEAELREEMENA